MKSDILLWGTGERAKNIIEQNFLEKYHIVCFIDTYKKEDYFMGYRVFYPEELKNIMPQADYLIIVNRHFIENMALCAEMGISWEKIIITDNVQEPVFCDRFLKLKEISEQLYDSLEDKQMRLVKINESDLKDENRIVGSKKYSNYIYMKDYFRYRTFEFVANEILRDGVAGAAAEFGVFKGFFASIINEKLKERKLYLFDTFEGFEAEEARWEIQMGRCDEAFVEGHKLTSVENVLERMPYPEKCVICRGFFPGSVTEEASQETFAFVSIDVDFEESTYQGLCFFYPRLSEGGVIFIHDYNTYYLDGIKLAVKKYEENFGIKLKRVPVADRAGTLIIIK